MSRLTDPWSTPSTLPAYSPIQDTDASHMFTDSEHHVDQEPEEATRTSGGWDPSSYHDDEPPASGLSAAEEEQEWSATQLEASTKRIVVSLETELSGHWARKYHTYLVTVRAWLLVLCPRIFMATSRAL